MFRGDRGWRGDVAVSEWERRCFRKVFRWMGFVFFFFFCFLGPHLQHTEVLRLGNQSIGAVAAGHSKAESEPCL